MYLTPKKARKKWCPLLKNGERCVADDCMGWRWAVTFMQPANSVVATQFGYCGYASMPKERVPGEVPPDENKD